MKTYQPKGKDIKREWHLFDVKGEVLGRTATQIAKLLMGKHKATYATHMDMGDWVVVKNVDKIVLTGKKREQKVYRRHSGYPGGLKEIKVSKLLETRPERVLELAVSGMLPDNRLKSKRLRRLKIYSGDRNPYADKFTKEVEK
jgi:large subunit ribosomal protein L13